MIIETQLANSENWYTKDVAERYYGHDRTLDEIVLHYWNDPSNRPGFASNLAFLVRGNSATANTVIGWDEASDRIRIVDTVPYPNVAFTSSGPPSSLKNDRAKYINCVSVGIEIDPLITVPGEHRDELIKAVGFRVAEYWRTAGEKVPLTGHNTYVQTSCPGDMPFDAIKKAAEKWYEGDSNVIDNADDLDILWRFATDNPANKNDIAAWVNTGKTYHDVLVYLAADGNRKNWLAKAKANAEASEANEKLEKIKPAVEQLRKIVG